MNPPRRTLPALALATGLLVVLSIVAYTARDRLYRAVAGLDRMPPEAMRDAIDLTARQGLLVLVAITGLVSIVAWRRGRDSFVLLACLGAGTISAYLTSELVKLVVREERPCRTLDPVTVLACPAPGDWSWPSNHSTIAAALATACILVVRRSWYVVAPIAALIALSRVGAGVHYVHDVTAGLAVGIVVTCAVGLLGNTVVRPLLAPRPHPVRGPRAAATPTEVLETPPPTPTCGPLPERKGPHAAKRLPTGSLG
ncbi:phosphatase PAP2 family protein [Polymorphospora sp. NPDC050346]|uniref:phosphatase PAP2 family protein n=1 Tax=Polymorphospora sp. NPDC050346 TaxID=3155780 RepID=UPI0033E71F2D